MDTENKKDVGNDFLLNSYKSRYRLLLISFFVFFISLSLILVAGTEWLEANKQISEILYACLFISGLSYNIFLGLCSQSTSSSVLTWVGLNIIFSPISWLFTMPMMRSKIIETILKRKQLLESYN